MRNSLSWWTGSWTSTWGCACGAGGRGRGLPDEGLVDVEQDPALPVGEAGVGVDRRADVRRRPVVVGGLAVEDPGAHVERLRGDAQRLGQALQDLGAGLLQSPLDLREVGVADPRHVRELAQAQLCRLALLAQVAAQVGQLHGGKLGHDSIVLAGVSNMQPAVSVSLLTS